MLKKLSERFFLVQQNPLQTNQIKSSLGDTEKLIHLYLSDLFKLHEHKDAAAMIIVVI